MVSEFAELFGLGRSVTRRDALKVPLMIVGTVAMSTMLPACQTTSEASRTAAGQGSNPWGTTDPFQQSVQNFVDVVYPHEGIPKIASDYGSYMSVVTGKRRDRGVIPHVGLDIIDDYGADVIAASDGWAQPSINDIGGKFVEIYHPVKFPRIVYLPDGQNVEFPMVVRTFYFHLSERQMNHRTKVKRGDVIGKIGDSGEAYRTHLHFEVRTAEGSRKHGQANPHLFWAKGPGIISCFDPTENYPKDRLVLTYPVRCK